MPIYDGTLSDGSVVTLEADSPPSEQDFLAAADKKTAIPTPPPQQNPLTTMDYIRSAPRSIGQAFGLAGKGAGALVGRLTGSGDTAEDVMGSVFNGKELPVERNMRETPGVAGFLGQTALGMVETAPKIAALAAVPEAGVVKLAGIPFSLAHMAAAGGLFGLDDQGNFSPKQAATMGLMGFVGSAASKVVSSSIAKGLESGSTALESPIAQKVLDTLGHQAAYDAYITLADSPELLAEYRDDPAKARSHVASIIGGNLAWGLLDIPNFRGNVQSATKKFIAENAQKYEKAAHRVLADSLQIDHYDERRAAMERDARAKFGSVIKSMPGFSSLDQAAEPSPETGGPAIPPFNPLTASAEPAAKGPDAIQIGSTATIPLGQAPGSSPEVGGRVPEPAQAPIPQKEAQAPNQPGQGNALTPEAQATIVPPDETATTSDKQDTHGIPVASVAEEVSKGARAIKTAQPGRTDYAAGFESLLDYATRVGRVLNPDTLPTAPSSSGQEHIVWPSGPNRIYKATHPNQFGNVPGETGTATAAEYFGRIALQNSVFGDDIRFVGVVNDGGKIRVVTSQPFIEGKHATPEEVRGYLESKGFNSADVEGSQVWYRNSDNVLLTDAHTSNFISGPNGVMAIDAIVNHPTGKLADLLKSKSSDLPSANVEAPASAPIVKPPGELPTQEVLPDWKKQQSYPTKQVLQHIDDLPWGSTGAMETDGNGSSTAMSILGEAGYSVKDRLAIVQGEKAWTTKDEFLKKWDNWQWGVGARLAQGAQTAFVDAGLGKSDKFPATSEFKSGVEYADAMRALDGLQRSSGLKLQAAMERNKTPPPVEPPAATPKSIALDELKSKGWNTKWPFVPADLGNADFVQAIKDDPSIPPSKKTKILSFAPGGKNEIRVSLSDIPSPPETPTVEPVAKPVVKESLTTETGLTPTEKGPGIVDEVKPTKGLTPKESTQLAALQEKADANKPLTARERAKRDALLKKAGAGKVEEKPTGVQALTPEQQSVIDAVKKDEGPVANLGTSLGVGQGMSEGEVRDAIRKEGTAGFDVVHVNRDQALAITGKPEAAGWGGFFWKGKAYLISDNLKVGNAEGAREVLREEVGHGLLRTEEGGKLLADVLAKGKLQLTQAEREVLLAKGYKDEGNQLLDEFIAQSAREDRPWWKQAVEQVRVWLSKAGLANLTNEETARLLLKNILSARNELSSATVAGQTLPEIAAALVTKPSAARDETRAVEDLTPRERQEVAADIHVQNYYAADLATRYMGTASEGAKTKLNNLFGRRIDAMKVGADVAGQSPASTFDEMMALDDKTMDPATKMIVAGSLAKNILNFLDQHDARSAMAISEIAEYKKKIDKLKDSINVTTQKRDAWQKVKDKLVTDRQNDLTRRLRAAEQAGQVLEISEARRNIEDLRQSDTMIQRVMEKMANSLSDEFLSQTDLTAKQIVDEFERVNGGEAALLASMAKEGREVSSGGLHTVAQLMLASDHLAERVLAIKPLSDPEVVAELDKLAAELEQAAKGGQWQQLNKFSKALGEAGTPLELARKALRQLQPRITNAIDQLGQWQEAAHILGQTKTDADFRKLQEKVFATFDIQEITRTSDGVIAKFRDPLSGNPVEMPIGIDQLARDRYQTNTKYLFDGGDAYVAGFDADPTNPKYDVRRVAAWRELAKHRDYYLNPAYNPTIPHFLPWKFDLPAFIRDPLSVLRNVAGRASHEATIRFNALDKVNRLLHQLENDPKVGGKVMDQLNRKAAEAHHMTVREWRDSVANELLASAQRPGTPHLREGEQTIGGHVVTEADWQAVRMQSAYMRSQRNISEEAGGYKPASLYKTRVVAGKVTRKAIPTGTLTMPMRRAPRAFDWGEEWKDLGNADIRFQWLDKPDNFRNVLMAHVRQTGRPGYSVRTPFAADYKDAYRDFLSGKEPQTVDQLVEFVNSRQAFGDDANVRTPEEIKAQIYGEVSKVFDNWEQDKSESVKPTPYVTSVSAENSFTKPRSEAITVPDTFHDFGVADYADRVHFANDAKEWYTVAALNSLKALNGTLRDQMAKIEKRLKAGEVTKKQLTDNQKSGNEFYDYATLKRNVRRINRLMIQAQRVLGTRDQKMATERLFTQLQSFAGAEILLSPITRTTHTFGMFGISATVNQQFQNAMIRPQFETWGRFFANGFKDVGSLLSPGTDTLSKAVARNLANPDFTGSIMNSWMETILHHRDLREARKELAIDNNEDVWRVAVGFKNDFLNIFTNRQNQPLGQRIGTTASSFANLHNEFLRAYSPVKYNDFLLNADLQSQRMDILRRLQVNALEGFENRREILSRPGWDDLTKPENVLTVQEISGTKGAQAERYAANLRNLFSGTGTSLDAVMLRYYKAVEAVKNTGGDPSGVPFMAPGEEAALDFNLAQARGLNAPGTRNLAAQGSTLRKAMGFIHGLPLYSMGRHLSLANRLNTESNPKGMATSVAIALPIAVVLAGYGLARIQSAAAINRRLFNQGTGLPTLANAQTSDDYERLMARSLANWFPIVGDIVNGAVLKTPDRMGHLDSMFVMYGLAMDLINAGGDAIRTGDPVSSLSKLARRWLPLPAKVYAVATGNKAGLQDYYNSVSAIRAALPSTIEARAPGGGGSRATATTPVVYDAIDAMLTGDTARFEADHEKFVADKDAKGAKNSETSWRSSILARNPWMMMLGRLPSEADRELILSRMSPQQRSDIAKSEDAFALFGQMAGTNVHFTQEQVENDKGSSRTVSGPAGGGRISSFGGSGGGSSSISGGSGMRSGAPRTFSGASGRISGTSRRSRLTRLPARSGGSRIRRISMGAKTTRRVGIKKPRIRRLARIKA